MATERMCPVRSAFGLIIGKGSVLLCLALLALFLLCGCAEEQQLPDFTPLLSEGSESIESENETRAEGLPFAREIRIILPESRSEALLLRAKALGDAIREKTGIVYTVLADKDAPLREEDAFEIVLGDADHADAERYLAGLKGEDYVCAADGYAAVIGGKTEEATLRAIDDFCQRLLPSVEKEKFMNTGVALLQRGVYDLGICSLGGVVLSEWQIVCDPDSEILCTLAERLSLAIRERSGYAVAVNPSGKGAARTVRLALSEGECGYAYLIPTEEGVTLRGENAMGLCSAADAFCTLLFESADAEGNCQASLPEIRSLCVARSRFHVSLLVGKEDLAFASDAEAVTLSDWIREGGQDAVAMCDVKSEMAQYLGWNLAGLYTWQTAGDCLLGTATGSSAAPLGEGADQGLLFDVEMDGEKGGIRWIGLREGGELPSEILDRGTPLVLTVFGATDGEAGENTAARMDCLRRGSVEIDGVTVSFCVYTTVKQLRVEATLTNKRLGVLDLRIERVY